MAPGKPGRDKTQKNYKGVSFTWGASVRVRGGEIKSKTTHNTDTKAKLFISKEKNIETKDSKV